MNKTSLAIGLIIAASFVIVLSLVLILMQLGVLRRRKIARARKDGETPVTVGARTFLLSHAQHIGSREHQQDAYGYAGFPDALVVALCDGMGGMSMGTEAARLATDVLLDCARSGNAGTCDALLDSMNAANDAVYALCQGAGGTTAVLAHLNEAGLSYASVGDSRIYLYRAGVLTQLGTDHVLFYDLIRSGAASMQDAAAHPERAHLTSYLGQELLTRVNATDMPLALLPGDCVLLVSDGINKTLGEEKIAARLASGADAAQIAADALFMENPYQDNLTCILIRVAA